MNKETFKKPWVVVLLTLAALALIFVGFGAYRFARFDRGFSGAPHSFRGGRFGQGGNGPAFRGAGPGRGPGRRGQEGFGPRSEGMTIGQVEAISSSSLALDARFKDDASFTISDDTEINVDGGMAALEAGDWVYVEFEEAGEDLIAISIGKGPGGK
jgi:hypothetical protein